MVTCQAQGNTRAPGAHAALAGPGELGAGLEPFLQALLVRGDVLGGIAADEWKQQLADAAPLEVELEHHARAACVERDDADGAHRAHRAVDAAEARAPRRVVLGDLVRDLAHAAGNPPAVAGPRADAGRPLRLDRYLLDRRLPLAVPREVVDVGEDVLRRTGDLDGRSDPCHLPTLPFPFPGILTRRRFDSGDLRKNMLT